MNKIIVIFTLLLLSYQTNSQTVYIAQSGKPSVIDSVTALRLGYEKLLKIYGSTMEGERPMKVILLGDSVWKVSGTLGKDFAGGVGMIWIRKKDGKILRIIHEK